MLAALTSVTPGEVGPVRDLVEVGEERFALGREREVDDVDASLDGPLEPAEEGRSPALEVGPQDAHRDELDLRGEPDDEPATGGPVTEEVARGVLDHDGIAVIELDRHLLPDATADRPMVGLDATVDDGHGDAPSGGAVEGPRPVELVEAGRPGQLGHGLADEGLRPGWPDATGLTHRGRRP